MNEHSIAENLQQIKEVILTTCKRVGRNPDSVQLIAVSKTKPEQAILEALDAGQLHFGENRMRELQTKMDSITSNNAVWHMIGTMQTNKIRHISHRVDWIHSVGKAKYLDEINKRAEADNRVINVLIQVNISDEDQKSGCAPKDLPKILDYARQFKHIRIRGLMGMAHFVDNPEEVRSEFTLLRTTLEKNQSENGGNITLTELSMGMSNDFIVAIEEGATMVRVGSAIFGSRNYG